MKTIKLMLIGLILMAFGFSQGGAPTQVDMQGPPTCDEVDTNGDGSIDRDEAREKYGYDPQGNPDPNFDQDYDEADTNGDGVVDCAEHDAAGGKPQEGDTCGECGYVHTGDPNEDHHHCDHCGSPVNSGEEMHNHLEADHPDMMEQHDDGGDGNHDGGKPQEGDTCGECGYVHTGDPNEDHHHCDHCGSPVNSGDEMHNHMEADHPDMMEQHDDGGDGNHDGGPAPSNHWDGNCRAMMNGESEYWLDSDGDGSPEDGPYAVWSEDADGNYVDCGPGGPEGPPPTCNEVDTNGDGSIDRDEAREKYGYDPQGNPDPNFDQDYDEVDTNGDGVVDCAEHDAAGAEGDQN